MIDKIFSVSSDTESGFDFQTFGPNRRVPIDYDGLRLVSFLPLPVSEEEQLSDT